MYNVHEYKCRAWAIEIENRTRIRNREGNWKRRKRPSSPQVA
jgi:hypothetical protein